MRAPRPKLWNFVPFSQISKFQVQWHTTVHQCNDASYDYMENRSSAALGPEIRVGSQIHAIQDFLVKNLNCRIRPDLFSLPEWVYQITHEDLQWSGEYVDPNGVWSEWSFDPNSLLGRIGLWSEYDFDPVSILIIGFWSGGLPIGQFPFGKHATPLSDTLTYFSKPPVPPSWSDVWKKMKISSVNYRGNDYHRD